MNLSILLTDFIDTKGMLKTYRFIPINQYNRIVVDRLSDICTDVKGNTDKDVGLLRVYNSDKCQLLSTTCKIKDFTKIIKEIINLTILECKVELHCPLFPLQFR